MHPTAYIFILLVALAVYGSVKLRQWMDRRECEEYERRLKEEFRKRRKQS